MHYVIVLDFGHPKDLADISSSSISDLGNYAIRQYGCEDDAVILAEGHTYQYLQSITAHNSDLTKASIVEIPIYGQPGNLHCLTQGGSYRVLQSAKMQILQLEKARTGNNTCTVEAILIAHQYHVKRTSLQAKKLGLLVSIPGNLPDKFYNGAAQWWCRSKFMWRLRELIGYLPLKLTGQL